MARAKTVPPVALYAPSRPRHPPDLAEMNAAAHLSPTSSPTSWPDKCPQAHPWSPHLGRLQYGVGGCQREENTSPHGGHSQRGSRGFEQHVSETHSVWQGTGNRTRQHRSHYITLIAIACITRAARCACSPATRTLTCENSRQVRMNSGDHPTVHYKITSAYRFGSHSAIVACVCAVRRAWQRGYDDGAGDA